MKVENKTTIAFTILGILVGYLSYLLMNNYLAVTAALSFLYIGMAAFKRLFKVDQKSSWFISNGGWLYVFMWFIVWIAFYNL
jgi:hypothetical protein